MPVWDYSTEHYYFTLTLPFLGSLSMCVQVQVTEA